MRRGATAEAGGPGARGALLLGLIQSCSAGPALTGSQRGQGAPCGHTAGLQGAHRAAQHPPEGGTLRAAPCALPTRAPAYSKKLLLATFAAVLGNFSFGYALVYTSPVIPALERSDDPALSLNSVQVSWFGVRAQLTRSRSGRGADGRALRQEVEGRVGRSRRV